MLTIRSPDFTMLQKHRLSDGPEFKMSLKTAANQKELTLKQKWTNKLNVNSYIKQYAKQGARVAIYSQECKPKDIL